MKTLEDLIRSHIVLPNYMNSQGWFSVACKVCNDHTRKGMRAGFCFEEGTGVVGYNCFNCGMTAVYDPDTHNRITDRMTYLLNRFSIPQLEIDKFNFFLMGNRLKPIKEKKLEDLIQSMVDYTKIPIPECFARIVEDSDDDLVSYSYDYLLNVRNIDPKTYKFYVCQINEDPKYKRFGTRLILPVFRDGSMVFFQALDTTGIHRMKYLNPNISRDKIIFGFDRLKGNPNSPLFICEGFFDAFHLRGVAVFGNKFTKHQIAIIEQTKRRKVVVPDNSGDGDILGKHALRLGWELSLPNFGVSAKDIDEAVTKYGKIYAIEEVFKQIPVGVIASKLGMEFKMSQNQNQKDKLCEKKKYYMKK